MTFLLDQSVSAEKKSLASGTVDPLVVGIELGMAVRRPPL